MNGNSSVLSYKSRPRILRSHRKLRHYQACSLLSNANPGYRAAVETKEVRLDAVGKDHTIGGHPRLNHQFLTFFDVAGDQIRGGCLRDKGLSDGPEAGDFEKAEEFLEKSAAQDPEANAAMVNGMRKLFSERRTTTKTGNNSGF